MQINLVDWIVGGLSADASSALSVSGAKSAGVQVVGPVTSAAYLQGSIDGTNWESLVRVQVDASGSSQVQLASLPPVAHFRVAVADDAGGSVSVSAALSS